MLKKIDVEIPYYIRDEIEKYLWKKENGKGCSATFDNILALIGLARLNKTISEEQAIEIREKIYKLK